MGDPWDDETEPPWQRAWFDRYCEQPIATRARDRWRAIVSPSMPRETVKAIADAYHTRSWDVRAEAFDRAKRQPVLAAKLREERDASEASAQVAEWALLEIAKFVRQARGTEMPTGHIRDVLRAVRTLRGTPAPVTGETSPQIDMSHYSLDDLLDARSRHR